MTYSITFQAPWVVVTLDVDGGTYAVGSFRTVEEARKAIEIDAGDVGHTITIDQ